ncbi:MAG: DUF1844 domain-containing protein [Desulfobacterales bacterium]|jgi:hypothetical protein|nr:DUF1844 domain-containing protein [Desulfobacterales bacterium]MCU0585293.1 DUF1844 domain-containing protein [Desulfobacterales bacterium]
MSEEKEKGFVVKDRRMFSPEGRPEEPPRAEPAEQPAQEAPAAREREPQAPLPEINFPTFVASLNASALVHLGVIEDPVSGKAEKNLPMAKQTIDILSMLQQKTSGNLSADEEGMLKSILYDLRILYVKEKG